MKKHVLCDRQRVEGRKAWGADKEALKSAAVKRNQRANQRLKEVLSAEQYQKLEAHRKQVREKRKAKKEDSKGHDDDPEYDPEQE